YQAASGTAATDVLTASTSVAIPITGASWSTVSGGQITLSVATNLVGELPIGSSIAVSGIASSGGSGDGFNGQFVVARVSSSVVRIVRAPGTYQSGGTVSLVGGSTILTAVTGAAWPAVGASQLTFAVGADLRSQLAVGSLVTIAGVQSTNGAGLGFNGQF